jgi:hypothetical protein
MLLTLLDKINVQYIYIYIYIYFTIGTGGGRLLNAIMNRRVP